VPAGGSNGWWDLIVVFMLGHATNVYDGRGLLTDQWKYTGLSFSTSGSLHGGMTDCLSTDKQPTDRCNRHSLLRRESAIHLKTACVGRNTLRHDCIASLST
jgi:hypothetical protein